MAYVAVTFLSLSLLLAIAAFLKERRLRQALQQIVKRLIEHWRIRANMQEQDHPDRRELRDGGERVHRE